MELTRFRGLLHTWERGGHDAEESFTVPAGASAAAGGAGAVRAEPGIAGRGVRANGSDDPQLAVSGGEGRGEALGRSDDG